MPRRSTEREESFSTLKGTRGASADFPFYLGELAELLDFDLKISEDLSSFCTKLESGCDSICRHQKCKLQAQWNAALSQPDALVSDILRHSTFSYFLYVLDREMCWDINLHFQVKRDVLENQNFMYFMWLGRRMPAALRVAVSSCAMRTLMYFANFLAAYLPLPSLTITMFPIAMICHDTGLSENRIYSQWNSHLIGIMIINHWV